MTSDPANLYIVATPIGNLKDISFRAIDTIKQCDYIICENPKHSLKLLSNLGIKKKLISLHDHNEEFIISKVDKDLKNKKIVLISDAGSPLISDPGYKLIRHCINSDVKITTIPGASSIIPALQLSGLPINSFYFAGFFPKTKKQMSDFIKHIKHSSVTSLFFISNHKLGNCLNLIETELGNREISVIKELTKINEKVFRGSGAEISKKVLKNNEKAKGEYIILVNANPKKKLEIEGLEDSKYEIDRMLSKFSLTEVSEIVHKLSGINKNKIYKWLLNIKKK